MQVNKEKGGFPITHNNTQVSQEKLPYLQLEVAKWNTMFQWPIKGRVAAIPVNASDGTKYYMAHFLRESSYYYKNGPDYRYVTLAKAPVKNVLASDRWLVSAYSSDDRGFDFGVYYVTICILVFLVGVSVTMFVVGVFASPLRRQRILCKEDRARSAQAKA